MDSQRKLSSSDSSSSWSPQQQLHQQQLQNQIDFRMKRHPELQPFVPYDKVDRFNPSRYSAPTANTGSRRSINNGGVRNTNNSASSSFSNGTSRHFSSSLPITTTTTKSIKTNNSPKPSPSNNNAKTPPKKVNQFVEPRKVPIKQEVTTPVARKREEEEEDQVAPVTTLAATMAQKVPEVNDKKDMGISLDRKIGENVITNDNDNKEEEEHEQNNGTTFIQEQRDAMPSNDQNQPETTNVKKESDNATIEPDFFKLKRFAAEDEHEELDRIEEQERKLRSDIMDSIMSKLKPSS